VSRRRLIDRIDDWLSPIVVKELRQAVQSKLVLVVLLTFLFVQVLILGTTLVTSEVSSRSNLDFTRGRSLFLWLNGFMLGACLLVPLYVGVRLAFERSDTNVDLLFITTLKPWSILHGKFLSGVTLMLLIMSACTPFLTFTYLMRGLDVPTILFVLGLDVLFSLWALSTMIFLAVIPAPLLVRLFLGLIGLGQVFGLLSWGAAMASELVHRDAMYRSINFWAQVLAILTVALTSMLLQLSWSLALLSPPSSNRALPMRLVALFTVIVSGVVSVSIAEGKDTYTPLIVWLAMAVHICCTQMVISVNERERLGVRVTRKIPRSRLLRLAAFLLYSGSAGGVLFSTLLLLASLAAALFIVIIKGDSSSTLSMTTFGVPAMIGSTSGWMYLDQMYMMIRFAVVTFLYTYCYCMTAVVVRTLLFRSQVRASFTWLIVLLLVGLGSVGPYLAAYFLSDHRLSHREDAMALVTNPFETIGHVMSYYERSAHDPFDIFCLPVLLAWAGIATAFSLPWMLKQFVRFAPSRKTESPVIPVEPVLVESGTSV
jgi:hypothetical protein